MTLWCTESFMTKITKDPAQYSDAAVDTRIDDADGCPATVKMSLYEGGPLQELRVVPMRNGKCMILDLGINDAEMKIWEMEFPGRWK